MAQREMTISIIGCLNNCVRDYREKMRILKNLLESVKDDIEYEIRDYLPDDSLEESSIDEIIDDFFDLDHGMIGIGSCLIQDLQNAKWGDFDKMEILKADTEEEKENLKKLTEMLD